MHLPDGKCVIRHVEQENAEAIASLLEAHKIEYRGQSLPAAVQSVFFELTRPERQHLSKTEREELFDKQEGKCEMCQSPLEKCEADHVAPLRDLLVGQEQAFRLLCLTCHSEVSEPSQRRATNPIISQFNPFTYEAYVRSPRPVQCVQKLNNLDPNRELVNVDVRRCRRSCLVNSTEPWPVFCAHDEVLSVLSQKEHLSEVSST